MTNHFRITLLTFACLVQSASAALPPSWKKDINLDLEKEDRDVLVTVSLDEEVYDKTPDNFANLRILNAQGNDVSYRLITESDTRKQTQKHRWSPQNISLSPSDEQLEIEFSLKTGAPSPSQLEIITPLRNFEQRVRIYGMGNNERLLADDAIFDYSRYMDVRRTDVSFPETEFRRFRIVIDNPTSEQESRLLQLTRQLRGNDETGRQERFTVERRPFRIDRLQLVSTVERNVPEHQLVTDWAINITQNTEDEKLGQTHIEFEKQRQPLTQITLQTDSQNFSRRAWIETARKRSGKITWDRMAKGHFSHFSFGDYEKIDDTLKFPETRAEMLRLVIENEDSPPLKVKGISAAGHRHQLLFLARGDETYEFHYGSPAENPPNYDTAAIELMQAQGINPIVADLGPEIQLTEDAGKQSKGLKAIINNPVILGAIILVIALVLGWSLYQASRKVSEMDTRDVNDSQTER